MTEVGDDSVLLSAAAPVASFDPEEDPDRRSRLTIVFVRSCEEILLVDSSFRHRQ